MEMSYGTKQIRKTISYYDYIEDARLIKNDKATYECSLVMLYARLPKQELYNGPLLRRIGCNTSNPTCKFKYSRKSSETRTAWKYVRNGRGKFLAVQEIES